MKHFVTGGAGFVGRHLVLRLLADGHEVRALAGSDEEAAAVTALGATPVRADLPDLDEVLRGVGIVVNAAMEPSDQGRPGRRERDPVAGTRALLDAAHRSGVRRLVHVSTEAVLASGRPLRYVDETAAYPRKHAGEHARTTALAEQVVLASNSRELVTVAVRPRLVWGPGDTELLPQVLAAAEQGRWAWVNGGNHLTSTCHVRNLCEGIVLAAEKGRGGQAYFLTDGAPVELRSFLTRCAAAYGVTLPDRSVPLPVTRTTTTVLEKGRRVLQAKGEPPVAYVAVALGGREVTVDDSRARRELGYVPVVTVDEGIEELRELSGPAAS
ncbi:NAD-dependent epimerase/dehydratase family protein [Nocardioides caldifontis]|uniref:NAD-dependent epimerase/dehydratase family protein n=1 Tax=Nocardioides caldifontis TaxID=2588938 RepID=UPI001396895A|nr:NAD-dependent epimerase/dehydratase family protein [Nocardioides caldifontis]